MFESDETKYIPNFKYSKNLKQILYYKKFENLVTMYLRQFLKMTKVMIGLWRGGIEFRERGKNVRSIKRKKRRREKQFNFPRFSQLDYLQTLLYQQFSVKPSLSGCINKPL